MKTTLLWLLALGIGMQIHAQQLSPAVIAADGAASRGPTMTLQWTLGELAVQTLSQPNGLLTEGFHQPLLQVTESFDAADPGSSTPALAGLAISVYPNPVTAQLTVELLSAEEGQAFVELRDARGRRLELATANLSGQTLQWDLSAYPAGMYLLYFRTDTGEMLKHYKITKVR